MSDLPLTSSATYLTVCAQLFSRDDDSAVPWSEACQDPLSVGFPRQEYWNLLPVPTPGDLPDPGIEPMSLAFPAFQVDSLLLSHQGGPLTLERSDFPSTQCLPQ